MQTERTPKIAPCENCGAYVQTSLGSAGGFPMGVKTATGYACGPCMKEALRTTEQTR